MKIIFIFSYKYVNFCVAWIRDIISVAFFRTANDEHFHDVRSECNFYTMETERYEHKRKINNTQKYNRKESEQKKRIHSVWIYMFLFNVILAEASSSSRSFHWTSMASFHWAVALRVPIFVFLQFFFIFSTEVSYILSECQLYAMKMNWKRRKRKVKNDEKKKYF